MFTLERPNQQKSPPSLRRTCMLHNFIQIVRNFTCCHGSMGLAGIRDRDNMQLFDHKKPLVVVYYDVDYVRNPKGKGELTSNGTC